MGGVNEIGGSLRVGERLHLEKHKHLCPLALNSQKTHLIWPITVPIKCTHVFVLPFFLSPVLTNPKVTIYVN